MKRWFGVALAGSVAVALLSCATVLLTPFPAPGALPALAPPAAPPASLPPQPLPVSPGASPGALAPDRSTTTATPAIEAPPLTQAEAIQFMQELAEQGDPRSPALGGLKSRQRATAAELSDPRQYAALEERQTRELLQAYASGVQQIPEIRARIEAAAQSGERSVTELDEARAALEQMEAMRGRLEREAPQLLPDETVAPPAPD